MDLYVFAQICPFLAERLTYFSVRYNIMPDGGKQAGIFSASGLNIHQRSPFDWEEWFMSRRLFENWRCTLSDSKFDVANASWPVFTQAIAIGTFGNFEDHRFEPKFSCSRWGVNPELWGQKIETSGLLELASGAHVAIGAHAGAMGGSSQVRGDICIDQDSGHLFRAPESSLAEIEDLEDFGLAVYQAAKASGEKPGPKSGVVYAVLTVNQGYFVGSEFGKTAIGVSGRYEELKTGSVKGNLVLRPSRSHHVAFLHPENGGSPHPGVVGYKVLSWSQSGNKVYSNVRP